MLHHRVIDRYGFNFNKNCCYQMLWDTYSLPHIYVSSIGMHMPLFLVQSEFSGTDAKNRYLEV